MDMNGTSEASGAGQPDQLPVYDLFSVIDWDKVTQDDFNAAVDSNTEPQAQDQMSTMLPSQGAMSIEEARVRWSLDQFELPQWDESVVDPMLLEPLQGPQAPNVQPASEYPVEPLFGDQWQPYLAPPLQQPQAPYTEQDFVYPSQPPYAWAPETAPAPASGLPPAPAPAPAPVPAKPARVTKRPRATKNKTVQVQAGENQGSVVRHCSERVAEYMRKPENANKKLKNNKRPGMATGYRQSLYVQRCRCCRELEPICKCEGGFRK